jgi:glucose-6-phosphate isomerase
MEVPQFGNRFFTEKLNDRANQLLPEAVKALNEIKEQVCVGCEWTGWYDYPQRKGFELVKSIKEFKENLDVFYDLIVVVGIGGSYLGTRAVADALTHEHAGALGKTMIVYAGHHVSETGMVEIMDLLAEKQPIINVISKSGTTTEPSVAFRVIRQYMEKRFGKKEATKRIIATTDEEKGALKQLSDEMGYKTFVVPSDIGGRYSVLTPVGLLPLALLDVDIAELMNGADDVFKTLQNCNEDHPVLRYAASRNAAFEADKRVEILSFAEPKLRHLVEWWKQLFGESEGKQHKGLLPSSLAFTTDLHSLGQYVQDGCRNLIETFLMFEDATSVGDRNVERRLRIPVTGDNSDELQYLEGRFIDEINQAAMLGSEVAHFDGGVPCMEIKMKKLNERSIGQLFAFFETACGISGAILGVNPYDQPGVEAYKKNLFALLNKPGFESLGEELKKRL